MPSTTPTARQSHIDRALTNVAIAYSNAELIWPQIFPQVTVQKQSDYYFTFDKASFFRRDAALRAPGTRATRGSYTLSKTLYTCNEVAIAHAVPDEVIENSDDPLTPLVRSTQYCSSQIQSHIENDVLDLIFGNSIWSSSATPGTLWSNDASDPFGDIETGMNSVASVIGREPNTGVIGRGLWRYLKNHPDVIDRVKGGATVANPAKAATEAIAALTGLERVLVASSIEDTRLEDSTTSVTMSYIGGLHMVLMYVAPGPALDVPSAGYTFQWKTFEVNRYTEEQEHSTVIEARLAWDAKVTASDAGYLIKSAA